MHTTQNLTMMTHSDTIQDEKLRIGYILCHFPVPSETFIINEIIALQSIGIDIHPIALFPSELCQEKLVAKIKRAKHDIAKSKTTQAYANSPLFGKARQLVAKHALSESYVELAVYVADYVLENKLQHLHAHFAAESALVAMLVSELTGVPFSFTAHAYDLFINNPGRPGETRDNRLKALLDRAANVVVISEFNKRFLLQIGGTYFADKIKVIHCGIDTDHFVPQDRRHSDTLTLLCVGRFVQKKGHEFLLKAFRKVVDVLPDTRLRLIGEGNLKPAMTALCMKLGLEDTVTFLGNLPSEIVAEEMKRADIFVLHSVTADNGDREGIPVSLMEASASGLPVISTHHSGIPELVIENRTGFLANERDIDQLAAHILRLGKSADLRHQQGIAGRLYVQTKFNQTVEAAKLKISLQKSLHATAQALTSEKTAAEMAYWRERKRVEGALENSHYKYFYTEHFELDDNYYSGKKLLDIGCGPRGSLEWATMAGLRIGIDPLADYYKMLGTDKHVMEYIATGSESIPFPDEYFDSVTSFNSLDHVDNLEVSIQEIKRVLKPGGTFLLLSDVNHKPTICEPISFSWDIVDKFKDSFTLIKLNHYEKSTDGIYVKNAIPFDHNNKTDRYGVVSAMFTKTVQSISNSSDKEIPLFPQPDHLCNGRATQAVSSELVNKFQRPKNIPFISVVIPTYNRDHFIADAIHSTLAQNHTGFEVIVVDDGSTDKTLEVVESFSDPRLRYVVKEHNGAPATRNRCIAEAQGEFLVWLDSDDMLMPDVLEVYAEALTRTPEADVLYGDLIVTNHEFRQTGEACHQDWYGRNNGLIAQLFHSNCIPNPGTMVRKSLYNTVGKYDEFFRRAHDYELWTRFALKANFKHVPMKVVKWRWHDSNMSSGSVKLDTSFDAKIIRNMTEKFSLSQLLPYLDWTAPLTAKTEATAWICVAKRLLELGDTVGAIESARKSHQLYAVTETREILNTLQSMAL